MEATSGQIRSRFLRSQSFLGLVAIITWSHSPAPLEEDEATGHQPNPGNSLNRGTAPTETLTKHRHVNTKDPAAAALRTIPSKSHKEAQPTPWHQALCRHYCLFYQQCCQAGLFQVTSQGGQSSAKLSSQFKSSKCFPATGANPKYLPAPILHLPLGDLQVLPGHTQNCPPKTIK